MTNERAMALLSHGEPSPILREAARLGCASDLLALRLLDCEEFRAVRGQVECVCESTIIWRAGWPEMYRIPKLDSERTERFLVDLARKNGCDQELPDGMSAAAWLLEKWS